MNENERYEFIGRKKLIIKEQLIKSGIHHVTLSSLPADFYRMSKSQMERLSEYACDNMIAEMYDLPKYEITKRRRDFGLDQMTLTAIKADREDKSVAIDNEILRIVSNEYNNGNIPHTNSTPLNSEKELIYMKATGIVRRIDDLGRIVIPKEIRRTMRIREADPLEIFTNHEGEIILKKYSPIGELGEFAKEYADSLAQVTGHTVCITDRDQIIAVAGAPKKEYLGKSISSQLDKAINNRSFILADKADKKFVKITDEDEDITSETISPIICEGDAIGSVAIFGKESGRKMGEVEQKLATSAAGFLGKQMES